MADPADERRDDWVEEDGGGPVKSFLEHLEDLRWTLIKSGAALLVGMIVCLYATPYVVRILKWPLERAALIRVGDTQKVIVLFGTNQVAAFDTHSHQIGSLDLGTNHVAVVNIAPAAPLAEGQTNLLLAVHVDRNPPAAVVAKATDLVYLDPASPFLSSLHLALFAGILLAAPFIFYFIAEFVLPALKIRERKYVLRAFGIGVGLFLLGVCTCYLFILPRALKFAEVFALWMGVSVPVWRAETYFGFVTKFMLGMGLGFEMPVVLLALVKIGVLDYERLSSMRRYMIVINLIVGALLTTPEVFTQVVMAIMLQILYEISVWIAWYWERRERKHSLQAGESG